MAQESRSRWIAGSALAVGTAVLLTASVAAPASASTGTVDLGVALQARAAAPPGRITNTTYSVQDPQDNNCYTVGTLITDHPNDYVYFYRVTNSTNSSITVYSVDNCINSAGTVAAGRQQTVNFKSFRVG